MPDDEVEDKEVSVAFERVLNSEKSDQVKAGVNSRRREQLAKTVEQWLGAGLSTVTVERHQGRGGFVATDIRYELVDDGVADVEGVTVEGVNPVEFARSVLEDIRSHAEELGAANYRVVGHQEGDDGESKECFRIAIPRHLLGDIPAGEEDQTAEAVGGLLSGYKGLAAQSLAFNQKLQGWYLDLAKTLPSIAEANAKMLLSNAEALGKESPAVELELARLEWERERSRAEVHARMQHHRQERNAEFSKHVIDKLGPDLAATLRILAQRWASAGGPTRDDTEPEAGSRLARRLDVALRRCTAEQLGAAEQLLTKDEWALIVTARSVETDEEFVSVFSALDKRLAERGEAEVAKLFAQLIDCLGQLTVAELAAIIREVQNEIR